MGKPPPSLVAAALAALIGTAPGYAEDRVSVRGVYYREASTRIVQPMVQVTKDLPAGFDVGAHYLLDAITSASVAAGALRDEIFTERRNEVGLTAGKSIARTRVAASYRFSHEPDYVSHTAGLSVSQGVWENTGTLGLNLAAGSDSIQPKRESPKHLDLFFGGLSYSQVLTPTTVAQLGYDAVFFSGYLANPYLRHRNLGRENVPRERLRHALVARLAQYFPRSGTGLQVHYRYYIDQDDGAQLSPWGLRAHSLEGRVYQSMGRDLELRLAYRYHSQGAALFYCTNATGDSADCYGERPRYHSVDMKLGALGTHMPEAKLTWDLRIFGGLPFFGWFSPGAVEVSYGYYFQSTSYGGAHLLQTGYSLPF